MTDQKDAPKDKEKSADSIEEALANSTSAVQRDKDPMEIIGTGLFYFSFFLFVSGSILLSTDMFAGLLEPGSKERSLTGLVLLILGVGDMVAGYIFMRKTK